MPAPDAPTLTAVRGLEVIQRSLVVEDGVEYALAETDEGCRLVVLAGDGARLPAALQGERDGALLVGPLSAANAAALRERLRWLRPRTFGLRGTFGLGDRLGVAARGHVRALRATGSALAPILAQQSIRELDRSGREAVEVLDAATWGAFAEGWREGFGADADHLKAPADVDRCAAHGYTLYTIDPGDHVDGGADAADGRKLDAALTALPWECLRDSPRDLAARYAAERLLSEEEVARAAAKYGRAIAHVAEVYEHVRAVAPQGGFEVEVSVDETETPTTPAQHVYIATELRRLGVEWVSLAPRFVGRFEKGIDYIGDVGAFAADVAAHAAIAERLGPYKLSLHSGSDKLAIYPTFAAAMRGRMHVKTSGTSYLEALRAVADDDPGFVRGVYAFACARFAEDRASYHVAVDLAAAPSAHDLADDAVPALLDDDDARRILHVTFGSVLESALGTELRALLDELAEEYALGLERHFVRHLEALA
jgi:tagaturonate epimerase